MVERKKFTRQRKEKVEDVGEYRLRNGYGKHTIPESCTDIFIRGKENERIAISGDVLICKPSRIAPFLDKFERIDLLPEYNPQPQKQLKKEHKGGGRYNVINVTSGEKLNEVYLSKDEANELIVNELAIKEEDNEEVKEEVKEEDNEGEGNKE